MTTPPRLAALTAIALGITFSASPADAFDNGAVQIPSAQCEPVDWTASADGEEVPVFEQCLQKGGAVELTWGSPGGDDEFEVFVGMLDASGEWVVTDQVVTSDSEITIQLDNGVYAFAVLGLDSGTMSSATVLHYFEVPIDASEPTDTGDDDSGNADSGNDDSGNADSGNADSGNADSGNADSGNADSGNADDGNADSAEAFTTPSTKDEVIKSLTDTIAELEDYIEDLEYELDDANDKSAAPEAIIADLGPKLR